MDRVSDPVAQICEQAASLPEVSAGTSCNQTSYKVGKSPFLYIGPGAKGRGFKAMFKLGRSLPRAAELAASDPDRFEVGSNGWVTTRFSAEQPLPKSIWGKWLRESYGLASGSGASGKPRAAKKKRSTASRP